MQHSDSHKAAELKYTHPPVSTPKEDDLNSSNLEAIKQKYRYLICFCCWQFGVFKLHYQGICLLCT